MIAAQARFPLQVLCNGCGALLLPPRHRGVVQVKRTCLLPPSGGELAVKVPDFCQIWNFRGTAARCFLQDAALGSELGAEEVEKRIWQHR